MSDIRRRISRNIAAAIAAILDRYPELRSELAAVSVRVDDSAGWQSLSAGTHGRDAAEIQQLYSDALTAYRKNPYAKRIVDIVTDYVVGDGITPTAPGEIGRFVRAFWDHPKNRMELRLPDLCDELTRAGDLFLSLHRNPLDGMSYVRPIPKDHIQRIETAANDWETEIAYHEIQTATTEPRIWYSPHHPAAAEAAAVVLHYSVNRPVGALLGEGDLNTLIPWLLRYSRMLEDRVRLHWAVRAFLWIVTVPTNKVAAKREQYRTPPEAGSVIVKDQAEEWQPVTPLLRAADARYDLRAVRRTIAAGSVPPHWLGEGEDLNRAVAKAMNDPAIRHLRRRQRYIRFIATDLCHQAYTRAHQIGKVRARPDRTRVTADLPDISREDNTALATAARDLAQAMATVKAVAAPDTTLTELAILTLRLVAKFAGEPLSAAEAADILEASA